VDGRCARDQSQLGGDVTCRGLCRASRTGRQGSRVVAADVVLRKVDDGHHPLLAVVICRALRDVSDRLSTLIPSFSFRFNHAQTETTTHNGHCRPNQLPVLLMKSEYEISSVVVEIRAGLQKSRINELPCTATHHKLS